MQEYAQILNYAIPLFMVLIAIEYGASCFMHVGVNRLFDTISSLSSGVTNVIKDVLGLVIVLVSYEWFYTHFAIFDIKSTISLYILAFIGTDFAGYWVHRWSHEINLFWNRHIIHHSSEEYNLSCALRQSVSQIFALFTFTFLPMAILGIPTRIIAVVGPIQLFAQFWYHTRLISKMGWLEYILVTPSHHRVHHSINKEYMDKNYSQIFIIWDKLFGTFQPELNDIPPVYGVTRAVKTWNPLIINFQHIWLLFKDAWRTDSFVDKVRIWFMPTGWRPVDVVVKYPVPYTEDVYHRPKYETEASFAFKIWSFIQLLITLALMMFLFNNIGNIEMSGIVWYAIFLFISIFAYTSLMDGNVQGVIAESIKFVLGMWLFWTNGNSWFGLERMMSAGNGILLVYLMISLLASFYFFIADRPVETYINDYELEKV
ncbi:MAG: sterol desaturase family protein [Saprospiraceae bacterium]|jgi:sterol desaturase/sphingolipid hydroxylase (fatty acid hydroxylase superfamily)|nr:sterol desaturase family protein [Saprospiraceae bacterium]MBL0026701.1 sterol desaturase family protein [Saprospiraceae bacterium]